MGTYSTAAIRSDNSLWGWGYNGLYELGDGTTVSRSSPIQIGSGGSFSKVGVGVSQMMGIKTDGTLWTWGCNNAGRLGDGTRNPRSSPVQVGALTNWVKISAGDSFSVAMKSDGSIWAWGANTSGQTGDPTTSLGRSSPVQVGTDTNWAKIVAGGSHVLAIKS